MAFAGLNISSPHQAAKIRGLVFLMRVARGRIRRNRHDLHRHGAGIRWNSPFGPLRVDWGISKPEGDEKK
jgi:hypothetical protein